MFQRLRNKSRLVKYRRELEFHMVEAQIISGCISCHRGTRCYYSLSLENRIALLEKQLS